MTKYQQLKADLVIKRDELELLKTENSATPDKVAGLQEGIDRLNELITKEYV